VVERFELGGSGGSEAFSTIKRAEESGQSGGDVPPVGDKKRVKWGIKD